MGLAVFGMASCGTSDKITEVYNEPDPPVWTLNNDEVELGTTDFLTFDIARDDAKLDEKLWTDPSKKIYVENTDFDDEIGITYQGEKALVNCDKSSGITVEASGAHVTVNATKDVAVTLTGKSDNGSLKITGNGKVRINLNGVNLKSGNGPAINNQSKELCFLVTDSVSMLSDDSLYVDAGDSTKMKGCVCSKGKLAISGRAPLKIVAKGADAIHSGKGIFVRRGSNLDIESYAGSAIKGKNNVKIEGGLININSMGHGGHGIAAQKKVEILGGRTTILSHTGVGKNGKNSRGIKSDSIVAITGGIARGKESSVGGKGIRAKKTFLAKNCIVDVLTFGEDDKATGSKNRGIKAGNELRVDSSRVRVRTENGWNEGLSCDYNIILNNSLVELSTRDDAISAGTPGKADIEINNSRVFATAGMDAIDSNGTIHVNSGLIYCIAQSHLCRGFDCDKAEFKIGPEAVIVSLGQVTSPPTVALLEHPACLVERPLSDTQFCVSTTGKNDNLVSIQTPKFRFNDSGFTALLSFPEFKQNVSYDFCRKATVKPQHTFHGISLGGTVTDKAVSDKHTFTQNYTTLVVSHPTATPKKPAAIAKK